MKKLTYFVSGVLMLVGYCSIPICSVAEKNNISEQHTHCIDDDFVDIITPEHISEHASQMIRMFEGCRLEAYPDGNGKEYAIGYGHCGVKPGTRISQGYAEHLFYEDIAYIETFVRNLDICRSQESFDAIVSFVFNIGEYAFLDSKVYDYLKNGGTDEQIRSEIMKWVHIDGNVCNGLVKRRKWEAGTFR